MPLKLEEISPESELQQNLEQLNIADNDGYECDVDDNLRENEEEEESVKYDQGQDCKPTLGNAVNEEATCRSEDGSHEIGSNVTNDNDKDASSSVDESDFSLPKHRKDYPSDDERTDSEPLSNEEDEIDSENSNYRLNSPRRFPSSSERYEQMTPTKPSNIHLQVNGANVPFEISPMSLGDSSIQDDDIDVARIISPIVKCITDLKSEFRTQFAKLHYRPDPNLDGMKVDENWQHTEFEKSQVQHCYDAIITAGKLLDVIMPMQLPEEAKEHLVQARHILCKKALIYRTSSSTENINLSSSSFPQADYDIDPATALDTDNAAGIIPSNSNDNNKSSEESIQAESNGEYNNQTIDNKAIESVDGTTSTNNESGKNRNVTVPHKYRRGSTPGRKLRHPSIRGASAYSPKSGRRNQSYSPRTSNVRSPRSPRIGSTVTSSVAGSASQANNRRFVGFLPSRCFTCGGIGHFANSCPNKGSYITTSTSNSQQYSHIRRRSNINRFRGATEPVVNNSTSNE
ncbi:hypothetical protein C1645_870943 [Glomus cerebriforme]|uniref:CCHC-type domain-containing protein n=1 Tax=Glomus cerebriforme TaxID=658196 RepID=A0A397TJA4_9GLOM|nr:hypothetical protein C1645_870943 [Glomus cerebriforme]